MKNVLTSIIIILLWTTCSVPQKASAQEGIKGQVVWLEGNLMPAIGDSTYQQRASGKAVQRTLLIYEATKRSETEKSDSGPFYSKIKSKLITESKTYENGNFKEVLPPGKYSIFVKEDSGLFANVFDGEGIINPVTVEAKKFTDIVIKVNYMAVY